MDEILKYDSEFSEAKFKTFVDNVFIQIHMALMIGDLDRIKHFVSNTVFEKYFNILSSLKDRNLRQIYDEINVKQTNIKNINIADDNIIIKVELISRYMDYLVDQNGKFVSGINDHRIEKQNILTFVKKINSKKIGEDRKCPSCGASMDINSNGRCSYCKQIYNLDEKGFILMDIETR